VKASNGWSDCSFKDLLTLLKDMLPQGNAVPETVYEAKQIICLLGLEVEKIHARNLLAPPNRSWEGRIVIPLVGERKWEGIN
jgi:hypothetical protein